MKLKRTIDDIDGNPVEIEIDVELPSNGYLTLEDVIQTFQIARAIIKGEIKPPPLMPGREHRYPRKKRKA